MPAILRPALAAAAIMLPLTACETIRSVFPDKQYDYRYSTEIPPLELPQELKSDNIKLKDDLNSPASPSTTPALTAAPAGAAPTLEPQPRKEVPPPQNRVSWNEGNNRLRINEPYDKAWLIVAKALTHKSVEITDRNREQGVFFVEYDPQSYEIKDGSLWDEVAFFFGARDSHEQEYRVRVVDNDGSSEVVVTDNNDAPITQDPGLNLLKLLYDTIKADAEEKQKEEPKKAESPGADTAEKTDSNSATQPQEENTPPATKAEPAAPATGDIKPQ